MYPAIIALSDGLRGGDNGEGRAGKKGGRRTERGGGGGGEEKVKGWGVDSGDG